MKAHSLRPWIPLIAAAAVVAVALIAHQLRPHSPAQGLPSEPLDAPINRPDVPAWIQVRYIGMALADAKDLHVVHRPSPRVRLLLRRRCVG
jgi:hypothetical protein